MDNRESKKPLRSDRGVRAPPTLPLYPPLTLYIVGTHQAIELNNDYSQYSEAFTSQTEQEFENFNFCGAENLPLTTGAETLLRHLPPLLSRGLFFEKFLNKPQNTCTSNNTLHCYRHVVVHNVAKMCIFVRKTAVLVLYRGHYSTNRITVILTYGWIGYYGIIYRIYSYF